MGFLAYFFVLLAIAGSVLFGLDWMNAPLHAPGSREHAHVASTGTRSRSENPAQHRPRAANLGNPIQSAPIGAPAPPMARETIGQESPAATPPVPPQPTTAASATQPTTEVAGQQPSPAATPPLPPERPDEIASAPQGKPEPVAQQRSPAENLASTETPATSAPTDNRETRAKHKQPGQSSSQPAALARPDSRSREARRETEHEPRARVPLWAIRGAEAARREAEQERQGRAPSWAIRGAEAATREAEHDRRAAVPFWAIRGAETARPEAKQDRPAREVFRPFWESAQGW